MNKLQFFKIIIFIVLFTGCTKESVINKTQTINVIKGWEIAKTSVNLDIVKRDLFFLNSQTGYLVGYSGYIYKTINSGRSWEKQNSGTTLPLFSVFFIDENSGFIAGENQNGCLDEDCGKGSIILKTTNGGRNWTKTFFPQFQGIYCIKFSDVNTGLAIVNTVEPINNRYYYIARTTDGGNNWELSNIPVSNLYDDYFCVNNIVFIPGENQVIYKTRDFGGTWETISTPLPASDNVMKVYFYDENFGYFKGNQGVFKTTNGGSTWQKVDFPSSFFDLIHFYSESEGFEIESVFRYEGGEFPSLKGSVCRQTNNGGNTWDKSDTIPSLYLALTCFPQKDLGYSFTGSDFYILKRK